ncbi:MAG: hypothetical protein LBU32_03595 [Clostridiales bacterium]|nr:hypothetical protein [Clostridiales bacterium]
MAFLCVSDVAAGPVGNGFYQAWRGCGDSAIDGAKVAPPIEAEPDAALPKGGGLGPPIIRSRTQIGNPRAPPK